jgi:hypothetical protein
VTQKKKHHRQIRVTPQITKQTTKERERDTRVSRHTNGGDDDDDDDDSFFSFFFFFFVIRDDVLDSKR